MVFRVSLSGRAAGVEGCRKAGLLSKICISASSAASAVCVHHTFLLRLHAERDGTDKNSWYLQQVYMAVSQVVRLVLSLHVCFTDVMNSFRNPPPPPTKRKTTWHSSDRPDKM